MADDLHAAAHLAATAAATVRSAQSVHTASSAYPAAALGTSDRPQRAGDSRTGNAGAPGAVVSSAGRSPARAAGARDASGATRGRRR